MSVNLAWLGNLYRVVLRTNRILAPEMRALADSYASSEFKAFRTSEKQGKATNKFRGEFVSQWSDYCQSVMKAVDAQPSNSETDFVPVGRELPVEIKKSLSLEQVEQLAKLQHEATSFYEKALEKNAKS